MIHYLGRPVPKRSAQQSRLEITAAELREKERIRQEREARGADHGTMGMAMTQRPSRLLETIQAGLTVREMADQHMIDRMLAVAQFTPTQYKAAQKVLEMHDRAGFEPRVVAGYAPPGWNNGHDDVAEEDPAIGRFRRLLGGCSRGAGDILLAMCLGEHPGTARLATLKASLDDLAKMWGV